MSSYLDVVANGDDRQKVNKQDQNQEQSRMDSQSSSMNPSKKSYTWREWEVDHEDTIWSLFWAISKTVEDNELQFLDQMEFSDFMLFCRKFTTELKPPQYHSDDDHEDAHNDSVVINDPVEDEKTTSSTELSTLSRSQAYLPNR